MKAGLEGIGSALPARVVTNAELSQRLDTTDEWIRKRTGIQQRHWLAEDERLSDLAVRACVDALADAGRTADEVDLVLVSTFTADHLTPGVAPFVALELGAGDAAAVDLNAACTGFLYGLDHGAGLIESGRAEVVLVCGAEALSRVTDHDERSTAVLFGDGAGAVVLAASDVGLGCSAFELHSDGASAHLLYADNDERVLRMNGQEVYRHAVRRMTEATRAALERAGLGPQDVDLFVAHQANARIIEAAAREIGVPHDRVVLNVATVANTSSASIPLALHEAERQGRLQPGATVALTAFGAGFTWGAGIVAWKEPVDVAP